MSEKDLTLNIEQYIKDLSPELQEKARACKTTGELLELAEENKVPIPDEALEAVSGGKFVDTKGPCPERTDNLPHEFVFDGYRTLGLHSFSMEKCKYCGLEYMR